MNYPDIPPVELLNQLAPDVKEYYLNKANTYYREKREREAGILQLISSGKSFYYTDPTGKTCALKSFLTKEN